MKNSLHFGSRKREAHPALVTVVKPYVGAKRVDSHLFSAPRIGAVLPVVGGLFPLFPPEHCGSPNQRERALQPTQVLHAGSFSTCVDRPGFGGATLGRAASLSADSVSGVKHGAA